MKLFYFTGLLFLLTAETLLAQTYKVTGRVAELGNPGGIPGAVVTFTNVKDSTERFSVLTDSKGGFSVSTNPHTYRMRVSILGFQDQIQNIEVNNRQQQLETVYLRKKIEMLNEVVVEGQTTPVAQKGDTTEMSAAAYKVNPDATAQDLVQKMPGITIENGTIKAHGEEVKRIMVDGKNYFGEDPAMALQNLPAEVIDKVQVYNKMSDQAEFTGFDDGNSSKVLNIVTRVDRRKGKNGVFTAGTDFSDKYLASARLNISNGDRRFTITGGSNNVNQQAFSTQDMLGVMGGGSSSGGRRGNSSGSSSFIGRQGGLNTTHSIGVNYTDYINKKLTISGSYFFNMMDNNTEKNSDIEYLGITDSLAQASFKKELSNSNSNNYNHRFDLRIEYQIDSSNSIIFSPRFSTQKNNQDAISSSSKYNLINSPLLISSSTTGSNGLGYNFNGDLTFRHKFNKKGRTISLGINGSANVRNSDGTNQSSDSNLTDSTIVNKNQRSDSNTDGQTLSSKLVYTEPLGTNTNLQFSYNYTTNFNHTNRYVYDVASGLQNDSLSNVYKNEYNTHRAGVSYLIRTEQGMNASFGAEYQQADLLGKRTFPLSSSVDKSFSNLLPNAMLNYKFSKTTNLRFMYRTSTNPPSVTQLQDVVDVSNSTSFSKGNPNLEHEYTHTLMSNFRHSNPDRFTNFSFNVYGNYTTNPIGNATYFMTKDTVIQGQTLLRNGQLTMPVNLDDSWSLRFFSNYGFLFQPIKSNLTVLLGSGYSKTPGYVNKKLSITESTNITSGLVVASNISQNIDFTTSYNVSYTIARNNNQPDLNSNSWYHSISFKSNLIFWKSIVWTNSLVEQINRGLAGGYNQDFLQWNVGLGKKFLTNNAGELKLTVYDVLNKNRNISHTVSEIQISDSKTNTLGRYFLLTFTYTLRSYKSGNSNDSERSERGYRTERRDGDFGPKGEGMGNPPSGGGGGGPF
jgi:hypothetical protein